ncbi:MAG: sulfatase-like hydrolase/transferase [Terriglobales bacterium]|jgi:arylsulfatase A-like enzyme/Flp pilus assembly protein TadD
MRRPAILTRILITILLLGITPLGPPALGQTSAPTSAQHKSPPDVYLITIDTLRADHVGCYGYKQVETPALDTLAADGVRFTQAFTHSPITNTSHITILTGLLPSVHGVTDFGVPLSPQHVTAAELLKKHGYQTAAFIGAIILDSNSLAPGLDRGFDFYDNFPKTDSRSADGRNDGRWGRVERRGMEVVEHAETWFDKHRAGPHFVWVHLYDPHDPYEPPPPFSEKYKDHLYDGEIAYADSTIARWIAFLKKAGVYDNAIIVVTGDHGEGLGEHGEETHGLFLYDSTLHIPLILKMPGTAHRATVVDTQVRTTDILPTILAATGVAPPAELNGESLLPLIAENPGTPSPSGRPLFGETDYPLRWGWAPLRALRADNTKWIEAPRPELYDLQADPKELKDLYAPASAKARSMQAAIAEWEAKLPPRSGAGNTVQPLPDPKDKIEVQNLLHNAMLASDDHRSSEARQYLEKALQIDPTSPTAHRQLGELEFSTGDFSKAAVHLKRAAELRPEDPTALFELGEAMEKSGDWPGARDALESSLKMSPSQISARLLLGRVYLQLKDAKNAADQFEAGLLVDSSNSEGRLGLAEAQIQQSDFAGALPDLEAFTKTDPRNAEALRLLARAYRGLGKEQDAQRTEQQAEALKK